MSNDFLMPPVSVIMPALNEEELIKESIDSIFCSDYPVERFEVICINDGSTDSTLFHMMNARQRYGEKLKVINFPTNQGKRKALNADFFISHSTFLPPINFKNNNSIRGSSIRWLSFSTTMLPHIPDRTSS